MKLTNHKGMRVGGAIGLLLIELILLGMGSVAHSQTFSTTTVQGTVYLANGQPGTGTLVVSWPSFTTASGQMVTADSMTVGIAPDGFVSVSLAPNIGATPAGLYYTAIFYLNDGTVNTQYRRSDAAELFGVFNGIVYQSAAVMVNGFSRNDRRMGFSECE